MIGLVGAAGTGKTTLAQSYAEKHSLPCIRTSASEVFARLGMNPAMVYPIEDQLSVQHVIMDTFETQYAHAAKISPLFVADRTPVDMAVYMLGDLQRSTLVGRPDMAAAVEAYVTRCIEVTNRWFGTIVLVQPGLEQAPGQRVLKAPACSAHMLHYNALAKGLLIDERMESRHFMIPSRITDLEERVASLEQAVNAAISSAYTMRGMLEKAGMVH